MHPDDIPAVQQQMAAALVEGGVVVTRYRLRHADGHWHWVETTARAIGDEIQCSTRDITELTAGSRSSPRWPRSATA